jgi:hypothetical protein
MKIFFTYLKSKREMLFMIILVSIVFFTISVLYSVNTDVYIYAFEICLAFFAAYVLSGYRKFYKKHKMLSRQCCLIKIYDLEMPKADNIIESDYQELIEKLLEERQRERHTFLNAQTELKDYYAAWAHQIKTPIAAVDLLLQVMEENKEDVTVSQLRQEMFKIDFYAEAVMNYLRLEDLSSDFKFEKVLLKKVVNSSVRRFAAQFIGKHISVTIGDLEKYIYTDEKWFGFIIEQLLSNAVKYTKDGGNVNIYLKDDSLVIEDNGIGISGEDLPRIMERGYTGLNGRGANKSSGIGLYLCKKAADKLGLTLEFESEPYVGTKVFICVEQKHMWHE